MSSQKKDIVTTYRLFILGGFGLHKFYMGKPKTGLFYLSGYFITLIAWISLSLLNPKVSQSPLGVVGLFSLAKVLVLNWVHSLPSPTANTLRPAIVALVGVGAFSLISCFRIVDIFTLPKQLKKINHSLSPLETAIGNAYKRFWAAGFFGLHKFYTTQKMYGVVFFVTFSSLSLAYFLMKNNLPTLVYLVPLSLITIGWFYDLITLGEQVQVLQSKTPLPKNIGTAFILLCLGGFFGLHHFYIDRKKRGFLYLATFGLFGLGWIFDLATLAEQVESVNKKIGTQN